MGKMEERFQYYIAAAELSDKKQKRAVLLHLIGSAKQEIFDTLSDTASYYYESAIASSDSYFMPKRNLYERYKFFKCQGKLSRNY